MANPKMIKRKSIYKGLKVALSISLFISILIIVKTVDIESLGTIIKNLNLRTISVLILVIALNWIFAGLRTKLLVSSIGQKISLSNSVKAYLGGSFISNVTPFATGGGPFQVLFLHRQGINVGKASSIIMIQFVLRIIYFTLASIIFMFSFKHLIGTGVVPGYLFIIAAIISFIFITIVSIVCFFPDFFFSLGNYFLGIKKLNVIVKKSWKLKKLLVLIKKEILDFNKSIAMVKKSPGKVILAGLFTMLYWSSLFLIIPLILKGLGLEPNLLKTYFLQLIFYIIIPYMPTPGASGIAEIGFATLFIVFIPENLLGLVTFSWRVINFYLILLIGGFVTVKEISI